MAGLLSSKAKSIKAAEKIAADSDKKGATIDVLEGGATVRVHTSTFPVGDFDDLHRSDEKQFERVVKRALGVR